MPRKEPKASASALSRAAWAGSVAILPTQMFVVPFGLVSGVFASEIGMDLAQTLFMSIGVFAGAAQFAMMDLLRDNAPALILIIASLAINLRFIMYAATLSAEIRDAPLRWRGAVGYLNVDNVFATAMVWYRERPHATAVERSAFFVSAGLVTWIVWQIATLVGYYFGAVAPDALALDYSAPIAFLALAAPVLVDRPSWLAAAVATSATLALHDLPYNLNVVAAGVLGIGAGYMADRAQDQGREGAHE